LFALVTPTPPRSTLFPYTTLFRSFLSLPRIEIELSREERAERLYGEYVERPLGSLEPAFVEASLTRALASLQKRLGGLEADRLRSEEHTSELQSRENLVCRLLLEK